MPDVGVIIPAGGAGRRFGGRTPKQFVRLEGVPILVRTVELFTKRRDVAAIVVAAPSGDVSRVRRMLAAAGHEGVTVVAGGKERQHSVLERAGGASIVLRIRPGARCGATLYAFARHLICGERSPCARGVRRGGAGGGHAPPGRSARVPVRHGRQNAPVGGSDTPGVSNRAAPGGSSPGREEEDSQDGRDVARGVDGHQGEGRAGDSVEHQDNDPK